MFARTARFGIALVAMRAEYSPSTLELMEAAMKQAEELHAEHKSLKQTLEAAVNKSDELLARHAAALNALSSQTQQSQAIDPPHQYCCNMIVGWFPARGSSYPEGGPRAGPRARGSPRAR